MTTPAAATASDTDNITSATADKDHDSMQDDNSVRDALDSFLNDTAAVEKNNRAVSRERLKSNAVSASLSASPGRNRMEPMNASSFLAVSLSNSSSSPFRKKDSAATDVPTSFGNSFFQNSHDNGGGGGAGSGGNSYLPSPKIQRNPRDAASPKRSRTVVKRAEYGTGHSHSHGHGHAAPASSSSGGVSWTPNRQGHGTTYDVASATVGPMVVGSSSSVVDAGSVSLYSFHTQQPDESKSIVSMGTRSSGNSSLYARSWNQASQPLQSKSLQSSQSKQLQSLQSSPRAGQDGLHLDVSSASASPRAPYALTNSQKSRVQSALSSRPSSLQQQQQPQQPKSARHLKQKSLDLGQEQILFEQRLCDVNYGVAVRKIHSNGKSQLRYVRCIPLENIPSEGIGSGNQKHNHNHKKPHNNHNMSLSVPDISKRNNASSSSSRSVASLMGRISLGSKRQNRHKASRLESDSEHVASMGMSHDATGELAGVAVTEKQKFKQSMALTWGNKKKVVIPLCHFVEVRKGKTTSRTRKNPCHPSKLLSLLTNDKRHGHGSLDIEAPTKLDRDKFAKAFSVFLDIPLKDDFVGEDVNIEQDHDSRYGMVHLDGDGEGGMIPDDVSSLRSMSTSSSMVTPRGLGEYHIGEGSLLPSMSSSSSPTSFTSSKDGSSKLLIMEKKNISLDQHHSGHDDTSVKSADSLMDLLPPPFPSGDRDNNNTVPFGNQASDLVKPIPDAKKISSSRKKKKEERDDDEDDQLSRVSSLTQGYDHEIVEELHQAIKELRAELDASRAEAARAVKVAEQAIQSAESCSSNDWNSTVTHKAAEAAAQAQTRSAEALAKQRLAEEKLAAERKSSSFWRKQAQSAQDQAAALQTRLAVAQVQRAAVIDELEREKSKAATYIKSLKEDYSMQEAIQRETISNAAEQNRLLEIELDGTRRDLIAKSEEAKYLQEAMAELKNHICNTGKNGNKKTFFGKGKKSRGDPLLLENQIHSTAHENGSTKAYGESLHAEELLKIRAEALAMKKQFEMLRRTSQDELAQLPEYAKKWAEQASRAINAAQIEINMLKNQLSFEIANRRKILHEVQDLRGNVRVYCRQLPTMNSSEKGGTKKNIIFSPSHDIAVLQTDMFVQKKSDSVKQMCFEFDRMFTSDVTQNEVYAEMEELVLGSLEGFKTCLIAYGQSGSGKTHSMIGDFNVSFGDGFGDDAMPTVELTHLGIHFLAARQLFHLSNDRQKAFEDLFKLSILEIRDEKLIDLVAGTEVAESSGLVKDIDGDIKRNARSQKSSAASSESRSKLEIRTNNEGDTIVQGQVSVPVRSFADVLHVWKQSMSLRAKIIKDEGLPTEAHDSSRHLIATIEIISTNLTTGIGTYGKLQCVDLAASDVTQRRESNGARSKLTGMDNILASLVDNSEWKFVNKSISTLADVVDARVNFSRNPPYRNSTITHLLRDALESDTKTLLLVCVKSDPKDIQDTANSLRLASKIRKVVIGKATKRFLTVA